MPLPVVPDPSTILLQIPHWERVFVVIYLTAAFFSIPMEEESQLLVAFTWEGKQVTWTRLPQGFEGAPTMFSQISKTDLEDIKLPRDSVLVQYVDDLLIVIQKISVHYMPVMYRIV